MTGNVCSSNTVDAAVVSFMYVILHAWTVQFPRVSLESPNSLNGFLTYWLTIFGKRIIFIGDTRKLKANIIIAKFSHYQELVKIKIKSDKLNWYKSIDRDLKTKPTKFWKYVSSFTKHNSYITYLVCRGIVIHFLFQLLESVGKEKEHTLSQYYEII
jgi:hypothetical protein